METREQSLRPSEKTYRERLRQPFVNINVQLMIKLTKLSWVDGWKRAEVLGGLCNAIFLLALCFFMTEKIIRSFIDHPKISKPLQVLEDCNICPALSPSVSSFYL